MIMLDLGRILCFLVLVSCKPAPEPGPGPTIKAGGNTAGMCNPKPASKQGAVKILFVGNSLTYTNDLPAMVATIGQSKGKLVEYETIAEPNYALEDHWNDGCIQVMIKSGYYDFVVVQQGPSSQPPGAAMLLDYGTRIQELCKANDTKLAFFTVWPAKVNYHTFPGVIANYAAAAQATNAILCPAGDTWKQHMDTTGDFSYYGPDEFHPSPLGSKVAAEIIYSSLFP